MELIYFFAFWGFISLGILIYALVAMCREKNANPQIYISMIWYQSNILIVEVLCYAMLCTMYNIVHPLLITGWGGFNPTHKKRATLQ